MILHFSQIHQPKSNLYSIAWSKSIALCENANKAEFICFKQGAIPTLIGKPLKLYLGSNISSTESDINIDQQNV